MPVRSECFIDTRVVAIFLNHIIVLVLIYPVLDTDVRSHPSKAMVQALPLMDTVLGSRLLTSCKRGRSALLFRSIGPARPHWRSNELATSLDRVCIWSSAASGHVLRVTLMLAVSFMADRAVLLHHWCRQSRSIYDSSSITDHNGRRSDCCSASFVFHLLIVYFHLYVFLYVVLRYLI